MHYCVIFKEKSVTVDLVPSFREVMKGLADIVAGTFSPGNSQMRCSTFPGQSLSAFTKVGMGALGR
jgi:hypothetical protein